jgi:carbamate kinase
VHASVLLILTDVERVMRGFGTDDARPIERMTLAEAARLAEAGEFAAGSMGPKVRAALEFVRAGEGRTRAMIGDLDHAVEILEGRAGTQIVG